MVEVAAEVMVFLMALSQIAKNVESFFPGEITDSIHKNFLLILEEKIYRS